MTLKCLSNFLSGRTFQVRIGNVLSDLATVQSGVIQGSTLGPILYNISINPLLRKLTLPSQGFEDDLKFVADVIAYSRYRIQQEVDTISLWADKHCTPVSIEKCTVLHCGRHKPNNDYTIHNVVMKRIDVLSDLASYAHVMLPSPNTVVMPSQKHQRYPVLLDMYFARDIGNFYGQLLLTTCCLS